MTFNQKVNMRTNLLVIAGMRAAYMDRTGTIDIPSGLEGEEDVSKFIMYLVDNFILSDDAENFDEYIEIGLMRRYSRRYNPVYEAYRTLIDARDNRDETLIDEAIGYLGEALAR